MYRRFRFPILVLTIALAGSLLATGPASAETGGAVAGAPRGAAATIATGGDHSCALLTGGTVKCWGLNGSGQLGLGDDTDRGDQANEMGIALPAIDLGTDRTAVAISAGDDFSCALLDDASVKCWGSNTVGQLGQGDTDDRGDDANEMGDDLDPIDLGAGRTATAIVTGIRHACALLDDGTVKCWGENTVGQLGQGDTDTVGIAGSQMGGDLDPIDLGTGRTATAISAGGGHTCALLDDRTTKCWGDNVAGQLGQGDTDDRGDAAGEMGDDLDPIDVGTGVIAVAITTGLEHTCALLDTGTVTCWGFNGGGQLGQGDTDDRGDEPGEMGTNLDPVDLGTGRTALSMAAGDDHTCALLDNGAVKCWGDNVGGQLGQGDTNARGDEPGEMGDVLDSLDLGAGRTALAVTSGFRHTCALLDNGVLGCWGDNNNGQLGQGDVQLRGDGPGEMGANLAVIDLGPGNSVSPVAVVPAQPLAPGAIVSTDSVLLTWAAPSDNGGSAITGYVVEISTDGVSWAPQTTVAAPTASITGLTAVTTYRFRVLATNSVGTSPPSAATTVTTADRPVVTCPTGPAHGFTDVPAGSFAEADIICVKALEITSGATPTTFDPGGNVTREQMAAFLAREWRTLGGTCPTVALGFNDVIATSFAAADIACIRALGITTGTTPTTYEPAADVTREQMTAFLARLWRALGNTCPTTPHGFADVAAGSFATADINCVKALGITTGTTATTFAPADTVTREQMAAFLARLIRANAEV